MQITCKAVRRALCGVALTFLKYVTLPTVVPVGAVVRDFEFFGSCVGGACPAVSIPISALHSGN